MIDVRMIEARKQVREYLAAMGKRGGASSAGRELTRSHARQMVAIREVKRAAIKASVGRAANTQSQITQALLRQVFVSSIVSRLRCVKVAAGFLRALSRLFVWQFPANQNSLGANHPS
jgi:hypothetical protein